MKTKPLPTSYGVLVLGRDSMARLHRAWQEVETPPDAGRFRLFQGGRGKRNTAASASADTEPGSGLRLVAESDEVMGIDLQSVTAGRGAA